MSLSDHSRGPGFLALVAWMATILAGHDSRIRATEPAETPLLDRYVLRRWSVEQGLPERTVLDIIQAPDGYLWVATPRHVLRFDGLRFTTMGTLREDISGSAEAVILALGRSRLGPIVVTTGGAFRFQGNRWNSLIERPHGDMRGAVESGSERLWVMTDSGLEEIVQGVQRPFPKSVLASRDQQPASACGMAARGDIIYSIVEGRLAAFDGREWSMPPSPAAIARCDCFRMGFDGRIWTAGDGRLARTVHGANADSVDVMTVPGRPRHISCLVEASDGSVWLGTDDGIVVWGEHGDWLRLAPATTPGSVAVRSFFADAEGSIWSATNDGLVRFRRRIARAAGGTTWPGGPVRATLETEAGEILVTAAASGAIWSLLPDGRPATRIAVPPPLDTTVFTAIHVDGRGRRWLGTDGRHAWRVDAEGSTPSQVRLVAGGRNGGIVRDLAGDDSDRVWAATSDGLFLVDCEGNVTLAEAPNPADPVEALALASEGGYWIATLTHGLMRRDASSRVRETVPRDSLPGGFARAVACDGSGTVWIGCAGGLVRKSGAHLHTFTMRHGLPDERIVQLALSGPPLASAADQGVEPPGDVLWIGTPSGVVGILVKELEQVARGECEQCDVAWIGTDDGMEASACTGRFRSRRDPRAGSGAPLVFPTQAGISLVDPLAAVAKPGPPRIAIEQVSVDGVPVASFSGGSISPRPFAETDPGSMGMINNLCWVEPADRTVTVTASAREISVELAGIHLTSPERVRFRYAILGSEARWTELGSNPVISLASPPPGTHRLHVAAGIAGGWSHSVSALAIDVIPAWWQRPWAVRGGIVGGIGAVAAITAGIVRGLWRRRLQREIAVRKERERIARDIHDDLGSGLAQVAMLGDLLHADLPPHARGRDHVDRIRQRSGELIHSLDEIVWAVDPANDSLDRFLSYVAEFAPEYLAPSGIACRLDIPLNAAATPMPARTRHHFGMVLKESLHNVVRHSAAREATVTVRVSAEGMLTLSIKDDGTGIEAGGLDEDPSGRKSGLRDMRQRMADLGGSFSIDARPGRGTTVTAQGRI
jgi:signal transduction histidine kinase/ligand-binding sensor domain-containing protein